jgi:hypothetical protein
MNNALSRELIYMFSNKVMYKFAILSTVVLIFGILGNGGNLVQAQTPGGIITTPPGGVGGINTTPTAAIPSNNVTALQVYDNSTMVLEFGNGTTLASPYSKVWRISFLPAGNQTIGNIPLGVGVMPPPGAGATAGDAMIPPPGGAAAAPPSGGGGGPAEEEQQQMPQGDDEQMMPDDDEQMMPDDDEQMMPDDDEQMMPDDDEQMPAG